MTVSLREGTYMQTLVPGMKNSYQHCVNMLKVREYLSYLDLRPEAHGKEAGLRDVQRRGRRVREVRVYAAARVAQIPHVHLLVDASSREVAPHGVNRKCAYRAHVALHTHRGGREVGRPHRDSPVHVTQAHDAVGRVLSHYVHRAHLRAVLGDDLSVRRVLVPQHACTRGMRCHRQLN